MSIININSFTPESTAPGIAVNVETQGLDGYEGQDAIVSAAVWVPMESTGALTGSPHAILIDTERYTEFTVMIPGDMTPGSYALQIYLRIGNESFDFDSGSVAVTVTDSGGGSGEGEPEITTFTPMRLSLVDLNSARLRVSGSNLDKVEQWYITTRPTNIRMTVVSTEQSGEMVTLKPTMVPEGILAGNYKLKGNTDDGPLFSRSPVIID